MLLLQKIQLILPKELIKNEIANGHRLSTWTSQTRSSSAEKTIGSYKTEFPRKC